MGFTGVCLINLSFIHRLIKDAYERILKDDLIQSNRGESFPEETWIAVMDNEHLPASWSK